MTRAEFVGKVLGHRVRRNYELGAGRLQREQTEGR